MTPSIGRRSVLGSVVLLLSLGACAGPSGGATPRYRISTAQLEQALARRFPLRHSLRGLLRLDLEPPRLRLMPEANRLGAAFTLVAGGPALRRELQGVFDFDFGLRYEPLDQTIRAVQPRVNLLELGGLPRELADTLVAYGPVLAEHALHDMVLHRVPARDLALADTMGLQPGAITVEPGGLVIHFEPKGPLRS
jgi:hypothetical protein